MNDFQTDRRRLVISSLAPLTGLGLWSAPSHAQDVYPSRAIRFVVGTPPGTGTDASARLVALKLEKVLKQPVIVENKAGAHGQIACAHVKTAPKDGYTLLYGAGGTMAINVALYGKKLSFDTLVDFDPVIALQQSHLYLAVNKDLPIANLKDMVAYVKARQGQLRYGTGGNGTTSHLAMERLMKATSMGITHVPYRGSTAAIQDLMGGHIQFAFDAAAVVFPLAARGQIRLIAVAAPNRSSVVPDVMTLAEQGQRDMEAMVWTGLFAPAGTPPAVTARLNEAINALMRAGEFEESNKTNSSEPMGGSSGEFRKFVGDQIAHWSEVIKEAGIQGD